MESNSVAQGAVAVAIIIPLLTVAHIILAAAGCVMAFYIVRGLVRSLRTVGVKIKGKAIGFFGKIRTEAKRLELE